MSKGLFAVISASVLGVGCGHGSLAPAGSAIRVPGAPAAAYAIVDGIRCSADVGAWNLPAESLPGSVIPVKIRVRNGSERPIMLRYDDFVLIGNNGRSYRPRPVLPLGDEARRRWSPIEPIYASDKFFVAPRFHDVYTTIDPWPAPLPRDESLYERQFRRWGDAAPPGQAVRMALPEGVLEVGGVISGFLFFESPLDRESHVTLKAGLAWTERPASSDEQSAPGRDQAKTADVLASADIEIPFQVE